MEFKIGREGKVAVGVANVAVVEDDTNAGNVTADPISHLRRGSRGGRADCARLYAWYV